MSSIFKLMKSQSVSGSQICLPEEKKPQFPISGRKKASLCFHFPAENMILSMLKAARTYICVCLSQLRTRHLRHLQSQETAGLGNREQKCTAYQHLLRVSLPDSISEMFTHKRTHISSWTLCFNGTDLLPALNQNSGLNQC